MLLEELLASLSQDPLPEVELTGIETNSLHVQPGNLFFALVGHVSDGHAYIEDAIERGAVAVVGTKPLAPFKVPYIQVEDSRKAVALAAKRYYNNPSASKTVIGITGTNGKTTTSFYLKEMLEKAGKKCALFGTVQYIINGQELPSPNTTPDSLNFQRLLHESQDDVVIMEVSSHGIDQLRIEGIEFDFAVFTNLDQDHLDYHGTMENYFQVKAKLFDQLKPTGVAVIWTEGYWGRRLAQKLENGPHHVLELSKRAVERFADSNIPFHNQMNAVLAAAIAKKMIVEEQVVEQVIQQFSGVPGRFEVIHFTEDRHVVIDYAHTADAFTQVLASVRKLAKGRVFHVFGFRGGRDETKRQAMVEASEKGSDVQVLTFDDLNGLPVQAMQEQLQKLRFTGIRIDDRTEAIAYALEQASAGDWVVITGKGNEQYRDRYMAPCQSDSETVDWYFKREKSNSY
ncbi:UDP-N-acetylmuramoyl-L-alanyl-D-glutamate--2,6-diaminopimelate ligase [Chryseomicrobium aureum]|uniref:UDP-N-acetylmuramoyl-L-alanyl-D-glutamate--2, 6-diaminopimelate ligase n=1 Tax=Chryseomicrobium aureum TaxID=1441723 RepID=UPI00370DDFD6